MLVVDFGAQYAQLIARRVREAQRLQRGRPAHHAGRRDPRQGPGRDHPLRRARPRSTPRAPRRSTRALLEAGVPVFGICYGFQAMAQALGRHGRPHRAARVRRDAGVACRDTSSTLFNGQPAEQSVWMSHGDSVTAAPAGLRVTASTAGRAGRRVRGRRAPAVRRAVAPRGHALDVRPAGAGELPATTAPGSPPTGPTANVVEELVERVRAAGRRRPGDLRAVRRRRLRRSPPRSSSGPSATSSPVSSSTTGCCGRARPSRSRRTSSPRPASISSSSTRATSSSTRSPGVTDPEEKRKIIGREFIRVFEQAARDSSARRGDAEHPGRVPRPGHALPRRRRVRRRHRHGQHQVAPQRGRPARRPAVQARRAAAVALQGRGPPGRVSSSACPRRSSGASRSPAPASASGSSARSPPSGWTSCAPPT